MICNNTIQKSLPYFLDILFSLLNIALQSWKIHLVWEFCARLWFFQLCKAVFHKLNKISKKICQTFLGNIVRNQTEQFLQFCRLLCGRNKHKQHKTLPFHYHCVCLTIRQAQVLIFAPFYIVHHHTYPKIYTLATFAPISTIL